MLINYKLITNILSAIFIFSAKSKNEVERLETLLSKEKTEVAELKGSIEQLQEQQTRLTQEKQQLVTKVC